jgi:long-chain fatty acid transport protein
MSLKRPLCLLAILATGIPMLASDGYFAMGYGTASKGMGGTGVALPLDSLSAAANPASMAFLGNQFDLGLSWFNPNRDFEVKGNPSGYPGTFPLAPGKVESGSKSFLCPSIGANWQLSDKSAFGVAVYGNGGMNTDYSASVFGGGSTGVNLSQLFVAPTFAYKVTEQHSIGVSAVLAYQQFEAKGLNMFGAMGFSADPSNLSDRGKDSSTGYGLRVGYLGQFSPVFSLGASYQTRTRMGELKKYAGLFAEKGGFDIPSNYTVGIALHATETLIFALDVERINYSEVKSISNPMLPNLMAAQLGNTGGAGFGWQDISVYKLGVQWQATQNLTLRAGYNHCDQPVPDKEVLFNILAPGVITDQASIGASLTVNPKSAVSCSLVRAFSKSVTGSNPLEAPGAQTITLRMDQWDFELGYSYKF